MRGVKLSDYEKESELIAYCGLYCRLCDYYTGRIRDSARRLLEVVEKHSELKIFAEASKAFDFEDFVKGVKWLSSEMSPCVGGCRAGGGWGDCPLRRCCVERGLRFCFECENFPCDVVRRYRNRVELLNEIKGLGVENWIKKRLE
mgnify:CR=1 FL=1